LPSYLWSWPPSAKEDAEELAESIGTEVVWYQLAVSRWKASSGAKYRTGRGVPVRTDSGETPLGTPKLEA